MDRLPVLCQGNESKKYDGKVWLELLQNVVEHNGQAISHPVSLSAFKDGDTVKVREILRYGKTRIWSGVVAFHSLKLIGEQQTGKTAKRSKRPSIKRELEKGRVQPPVKRAKVGKITTFVNSGGSQTLTSSRLPSDSSNLTQSLPAAQASTSSGLPSGSYNLTQSLPAAQASTSSGLPSGSSNLTLSLPTAQASTSSGLPSGSSNLTQLLPAAQASTSGGLPSGSSNLTQLLPSSMGLFSLPTGSTMVNPVESPLKCPGCYSVKQFFKDAVVELKMEMKMQQFFFERQIQTFADKIEGEISKIKVETSQVHSKMLEIEGKVLEIEGQVHSELSEVRKGQIHLQRKQDQLATKQDQLQTSIVGSICPPVPAVMTSPPPPPSVLSPSPSHYSSNAPLFATRMPMFRSPSCPPSFLQCSTLDPPHSDAKEPKDDDIDDIISFLSETELPGMMEQPLPESVGQGSMPICQLPAEDGGTSQAVSAPVPTAEIAGASPTSSVSSFFAARQSSGSALLAPSTAQQGELGLKTPEEVLQSNRHLWTEKDAGKLANKLARYAYFGDFVLQHSTRTGKQRNALDESKMESLRSDIYRTVFKSKTLQEFEDIVVPKVNASISALCKRLRNQKGK